MSDTEDGYEGSYSSSMSGSTSEASSLHVPVPVRYPEPTAEEIQLCVAHTAAFLAKNPMPEISISDKVTVDSLTRARIYRLNKSPLATCGKKIRRNRKRKLQKPETDAKNTGLERVTTADTGTKRDDTDDFVWKSDYDDTESEPDKGQKLYEDQILYLSLCRRLGVTVCGAFMRSLVDDAVSVRYHSLTAKDIKACCSVLLDSINIYRLDLRGNEFGADGAAYVAELLAQNTYITYLDVSDCCLQSRGSDKIVRSAMEGDRLHYLNLSGNKLQENDAVSIAEYIKETGTLKELHLSQNNFTEKGAMILASALAASDTIETLNLSWNHIRRNGAIALCNALKTNTTLREVNLAWNGFHEEGCRTLGDMLKVNATLESLDLTSNRIDKQCLGNLLKGCAVNSTLHTLKLGNNPITNEGAMMIVEMLEQYPECILRDIDISGQSVEPQFMRKLQSLHTSRVLRILHGVILYDNMRKGPGGITDSFTHEPPLTVCMEYMRIRGVNVGELFAMVDKPAGKKQVLTREELKQCLQNISIPISERSLAKIVNRVDMKDNAIGYTQLVSAEKEHKRILARLKLTAEQEQFEYTTIGMIHDKLNTLLYMQQRQ